jgi:putative transposase
VLVDTQGCLLAVLVLAADISDRDGAALLLALYAARYPRLTKLWGDSHYGGTLPEETQTVYGIDLEVVKKPTDQDGLVPLPKRWLVERTLAWLTRCRRLTRDYERNAAYSEAWVQLASIHRMLKHLAPDPALPTPYQRKAAA